MHDTSVRATLTNPLKRRPLKRIEERLKTSFEVCKFVHKNIKWKYKMYNKKPSQQNSTPRHRSYIDI
jgi:hypothetical protein